MEAAWRPTSALKASSTEPSSPRLIAIPHRLAVEEPATGPGRRGQGATSQESPDAERRAPAFRDSCLGSLSPRDFVTRDVQLGFQEPRMGTPGDLGAPPVAHTLLLA